MTKWNLYRVEPVPEVGFLPKGFVILKLFMVNCSDIQLIRSAVNRLTCKLWPQLTVLTVRGIFAGLCRCLNRGSNPNGCDFQVPWGQMQCHATHKFSPEQFGIQAMGMEGHSTNSERDLCGVVPVPKQGFQPKLL